MDIVHKHKPLARSYEVSENIRSTGVALKRDLGVYRRLIYAYLLHGHQVPTNSRTVNIRTMHGKKVKRPDST